MVLKIVPDLSPYDEVQHALTSEEEKKKGEIYKGTKAEKQSQKAKNSDLLSQITDANSCAWFMDLVQKLPNFKLKLSS